MISQLEPSGTNWIKAKEKFASRKKNSQVVENRLYRGIGEVIN
jgi:hypothetical protein